MLSNSRATIEGIGAVVAQNTGMLRLPLTVVCLSLGFAVNCGALTLEEISLMLRSGFSSRTIMQEELVGARVYGTFDAEWEKEFVRLHASPALIGALKSGNYAPSETERLAWEKAVKEQENVPTAVQIEGERIAKQAAEQQTPAPKTPAIVVAPAQPESLGKLPSEIEAEEKAERAATIAKQSQATRQQRSEQENTSQQTYGSHA